MTRDDLRDQPVGRQTVEDAEEILDLDPEEVDREGLAGMGEALEGEFERRLAETARR